MITVAKIVNHSIFHYLVGGFIAQIIVLFFWSYISNIIGVESIGDFHATFFWVELLSLFSLMGITTSYAKFYFKSGYKINDKFLYFSISVVCLIFSFLYTLHDGLLDWLDIVVLFTVFGRVSYDYFLNRLVVIGYSRKVIIIQAFRALLLLISAYVLKSIFSQPQLIILGAFSLSFLIPGISMYLLVRKQLTPIKFNSSNLGILFQSSPYMAVGLLGIVGAYATRLICVVLFDNETVGIIGLYTSFSAPIIAVLAAFNKFYYPASMESLNTEGVLRIKGFYVIIGIWVFTGILALVIVTDLISWVISDHIWLYKNIFYGMLIVFIPYIVYFYLSPYLMYEASRYLLYQDAIYVALSIGLQYLFFSVFGLNAIPYVLGSLGTVQLILLFVFISRKSEFFRFNSELVLLSISVFVCQGLLMYLL